MWYVMCFCHSANITLSIVCIQVVYTWKSCDICFTNCKRSHSWQGSVKQRRCLILFLRWCLITLYDANFSVASSACATSESKACAFQYPLVALSPKSCWQLCKADVQTNMSREFSTRCIYLYRCKEFSGGWEFENGSNFQTYWMQVRRSLVAVWICVAYDGSILCRL